MGDNSSIEWTEATWNPTRGCSLVSPGCTNCYAMKQAHRFSGNSRTTKAGKRTGPQAYTGLTRLTSNGPVWTGDVRLAEEMLELPLRWKKPRRIFVNSMSDLFHEKLTYEQIDRVFAVMALCPQHTFQVLTKRAERMQSYLSRLSPRGDSRICQAINDIPASLGNRRGCLELPLPNVWLGISVEDQKTADERIPFLVKSPAAIRWVSYEPALGPVDFEHIGPMLEKLNRLKPHEEAVDHGIYERRRGLDWIVVGGESGPSARPMHPEWARSARDQCVAAGVKFFF